MYNIYIQIQFKQIDKVFLVFYKSIIFLRKLIIELIFTILLRKRLAWKIDICRVFLYIYIEKNKKNLEPQLNLKRIYKS